MGMTPCSAGVLAYLILASIVCFAVGSFFAKDDDIWTVGGLINLGIAFLWAVFVIYK